MWLIYSRALMRERQRRTLQPSQQQEYLSIMLANLRHLASMQGCSPRLSTGL
jgi:hypothetical protein